MFIGHFAVGFAAKRFAPKVNLGVLIAAPLFLDLLWPFFVLAGWEVVRIDPGNTTVTPLDFVSYPWSHSLLMSLVWALAFALVYFALRKDRAGATVLFIGVFSHWLFDFFTHRPDMPLAPGLSLKVGLELWRSLPGTVIVELALLAVGVWLYYSITLAKDWWGSLGLWLFVLLLLVTYAGNLLGPPPPSVQAIGIMGAFSWIFFVIPGWVDRHRGIRAALK